jgi:microcystin-dependent protein
MSEPFVGQVVAVGFNFALYGWLLCNGQLIQISEYEALFSLIGTTYGGDGVSNFAVPNLQGRAAMNQGQGPGLSAYVIGQMAGSETVTLTTSNMPAHTHNPMAATNGTTATPGNTVIMGASTDGSSLLYAAQGNPTALNMSVIGQSNGGGTPHDNMQPFTTINYIIAAYGIYPSQG